MEEAAPRRGTIGLAGDLENQVALIRDDCPTYTRLLVAMRALVEGPHANANLVAHLDRCWRNRAFNAGYERPLLLLAALRHEAIVEGPRNPLFAAIGATNPEPDSISADRVAESMSADRVGFWISLTSRRVQTNEVTRGVAWRWPAWLAGCEGSRRPIALVDIGASAGLNLISERLALRWTDATGRALPVVTRIDCRARIGFDTSPVDVRFDDDVAWLRACIWPGDHQRLARFDDAVAAMRAAYGGGDVTPELHAVQAGLVPQRLDALAKRLDGDVLVLAYQTFVRAYLEPERQQLYTRGMHAWLASQPRGRALWVECELSDERDRDPAFPAAIVAHARADDGASSARRAGASDIRRFDLGRCGYHPRVVRADDAACEDLRRALAATRG